MSWLNNREVVVKMMDKTGSDLLGFFRVNAITGQTHRVAGLPDNDPIVLGAGNGPVNPAGRAGASGRDTAPSRRTHTAGSRRGRAMTRRRSGLEARTDG